MQRRSPRLRLRRQLAAIPRRAFFSWMGVAWTAFTASMVATATATGRFMFPNVLFEPPATFKAGIPDEIQAGQVDERFKQSFGVWLVRTSISRPAPRYLRPLHRVHSSRMHAGLAAGRAEIQVPVPRQRLLQERNQFRRPHAAAAGTLCHLPRG